MVGYLGRPASLVFYGGWRDSCSCYGSIPSITGNFICKGTVVPTDGVKFMVIFSIDTGLELLGVIGPICWVGSSYNLQPALKG